MERGLRAAMCPSRPARRRVPTSERSIDLTVSSTVSSVNELLTRGGTTPVMRNRGLWKAVSAVALILAVTSSGIQPASAALTAPYENVHFGLWPPNYCATAWASWDYYDGPAEFYISATTFSLTANASGVCSVPSPAPTNTFAAWGRLERYNGSVWVICRSAPHRVNPYGTWSVASSDFLPICGSGSYRFRGEHRITYGGTNQNLVKKGYTYIII